MSYAQWATTMVCVPAKTHQIGYTLCLESQGIPPPLSQFAREDRKYGHRLDETKKCDSVHGSLGAHREETTHQSCAQNTVAPPALSDLSHSGKTSEATMCFIAMQGRKVSEPNWQIFVGCLNDIGQSPMHIIRDGEMENRARVGSPCWYSRAHGCRSNATLGNT